MPSGEQSSLGLLADWPEYDDVLDPINRVFLPRADIATETLVAGLIDLGWECDDVTAYRTVRAAPPAAPLPGSNEQLAMDLQSGAWPLPDKTELSAGYLNHIVHGNRPVPADDVIERIAAAPPATDFMPVFMPLHRGAHGFMSLQQFEKY